MMTYMLPLEDGSEESLTICNKIIIEPEEGVMYNNKEEFKKALRFSAIKNRFQYRTVKENSLSFVAKCLDEKCSWVIRAIKNGKNK